MGFVLFAWRSWRTWPDLLLDFGHELYIPWRLSEGESLYRDIPFTMGPLSQYANALMFCLLGVSLNTLIAVNLVILVAISGMIFWLFRRCGTVWSATFVTFFFLAVFAFGQYTLIGNYNYVCPYRHEITHGMALGLAELICLVRFAETRRTLWLTSAAIWLGLVGITKLEMFLPAISAAIAAIALTYSSRSDTSIACPDQRHLTSRTAILGDARAIIVAVVRLVVVATLPILAAFVALDIAVGWKFACMGIFGNVQHSLNPSLTLNNGFYRSVSGMDELNIRVAMMFQALMLLSIGVGSAFLIDHLLRGWIRSNFSISLAVVVIGIGATIGIPPQDFSILTTPLPLVLPLVIGVTACQSWHTPTARSSSVPLCLIAVFALALIPKIILNVRWAHYGFALAMPGTLVLVHILIHTIPDGLRRNRSSGNVCFAITTGVLTACALVQFLSWNRIDEFKTQPVGEGGDLFFADPYQDDRVRVTVQSIEFLRKAMKPNDTLSVIPDGSMINYLLRKRNPTGFLMLNPWELEVHGGEDCVRDLFAEAAPDFVALVTMDMTIFGRGNFGDRLYGDAIRKFIDSHYRVVDSNPPSDSRGRLPFQVVVYQRRDPTD
jgi:hypothetical protein